METSEYFKLPKGAKEALKRADNLTEEEKHQRSQDLAKARRVPPKNILQFTIHSKERELSMAESSHNATVRERIPRLTSEIKRMKAELEAFEN